MRDCHLGFFYGIGGFKRPHLGGPYAYLDFEMRARCRRSQDTATRECNLSSAMSITNGVVGLAGDFGYPNAGLQVNSTHHLGVAVTRLPLLII